MRAALYYFSGTGNTWRTANLYAAGLQRSGWETEVMAVEAALRDGLMPAADCLGLGFPVYAFGPPRVVDRFLPTLPPGRGRPAFVWAVAGGIVGGATAIVCDRLEANGYRVVHERAYAVPENGHWRWLKPAVAAMAKERAWSRIEALVACAADELATGRVRRTRPGPFRRGLMSGRMWRWYMRSCADAGRYMGVTAACRSCGLCAAACPTSAMPANPLAHRVGSECTFCLRCASICPRQAVTIRLLPKVIGILHRHLEPGYADVMRAIDKAAAP